MNHVYLFAFCLRQKTVFLDLFVSAIVAYKTFEHFPIHLVDIYRVTVMTFGISTRV